MRIGLAIVGVLLAAVALSIAVHDTRLREVSPYVPIVDAVMFLAELVVAALLYAQAAVFRSRALTVLATGFALAAFMLIPHVLTFPGVFAPDGLLGAGVNTTAWIYTVRRMVFPIAIVLYVWLRQAKPSSGDRKKQSNETVLPWVMAAIVLTVVVTLVATRGHDLLPSFYLNRLDRHPTNAATFHFVVFTFYLCATVVLFLNRKSVLDMWLLVALSGWAAEAFLNLQLHARFTAGWYSLFGLMLASNLIVMVALVAETGFLYSRLALATAVRRREREARLMSLDAVTAAIAHEAGQPLAAVRLNATAGLDWLTQPEPNLKKAIISLGAIKESSQRTMNVIKSTRAMFKKGLSQVTEFSLNDLVRETAHLMHRELTARKVSLEFHLDETLQPILADRVQVQRVLVNLFSNAIDAMSTKRGTPRRITVRSSSANGQDVQLDVSDTGRGMAAKEMENIFDPFYTTKATGTGLGLTLSRTIAEEHGGRLWSSSTEGEGTTFHLRLPHRREQVQNDQQS